MQSSHTEGKHGSAFRMQGLFNLPEMRNLSAFCDHALFSTAKSLAADQKTMKVATKANPERILRLLRCSSKRAAGNKRATTIFATVGSSLAKTVAAKMGPDAA